MSRLEQIQQGAYQIRHRLDDAVGKQKHSTIKTDVVSIHGDDYCQRIFFLQHMAILAVKHTSCGIIVPDTKMKRVCALLWLVLEGM